MRNALSFLTFCATVSSPQLLQHNSDRIRVLRCSNQDGGSINHAHLRSHSLPVASHLISQGDRLLHQEVWGDRWRNMSCAMRRTTLNSFIMTTDDEDADYLPPYKNRKAKRSVVDYDNCRLKKSRTVGDLTALMMGCHDDSRNTTNCNTDDGFKGLAGGCLDSFTYFRNTPVPDVNMDLIQQFVFLNMGSPMDKNISHPYFGSKLQLELPKAVGRDDDDDDDDGPLSI